MRKFAFFLAILVFFLSSRISAQESHSGLGVIFIEPTGLSWKFWWGKRGALHTAVGWSSQKGNKLVTQADYLFSFVDIFKGEMSKVQLSFGFGGRLKFKKDTHFGIRFPLAVDFISKKVPLNFFLEIVPLLNLTPGAGFDLIGAVGFRYLYK